MHGFHVARINGIMQAKSKNTEGSNKKSLSAEDAWLEAAKATQFPPKKC
jgi:hypothetical protein